MIPVMPYGAVPHPPPRDERPYGLRTAEELGGEDEWVRSLYVGAPEELVPLPRVGEDEPADVPPPVPT